jgi:putative DNA primase/helicase
MTAAEIAAALGAARRSGKWWRCICPVHGSRTGRGLTLALRDGDRELIAVCHAGCPRPEIMAELRRLRLLRAEIRNGFIRQAAQREARDEIDDRAHRVEIARRIWSNGRNPSGTPVDAYLRGRGLKLPPSPVLRWAPQCWNRESGKELPAMLARVDGPEGEFVAVHRTWLLLDGSGKAGLSEPKWSLAPTAGAAVRLAPTADMLLVGEGIETCLAAMQASGSPTWAALSTSGLKALVLPTAVREIIVLADHDHNGAGERAAYAAAQRWLREGRRVRIALPSERGTDFADLLAGRVYVRTTELHNVAA